MLARESVGCLVTGSDKPGCCSVPPCSGTAHFGLVTCWSGRSSFACRCDWPKLCCMHSLCSQCLKTGMMLLQVPGDMLERHSKICCLLDEANDQVMSVDARLTQ